jgi:hypothetical protein
MNQGQYHETGDYYSLTSDSFLIKLCYYEHENSNNDADNEEPGPLKPVHVVNNHPYYDLGLTTKKTVDVFVQLRNYFCAFSKLF